MAKNLTQADALFRPPGGMSVTAGAGLGWSPGASVVGATPMPGYHGSNVTQRSPQYVPQRVPQAPLIPLVQQLVVESIKACNRKPTPTRQQLPAQRRPQEVVPHFEDSHPQRGDCSGPPVEVVRLTTLVETVEVEEFILGSDPATEDFYLI